MSKIQILVLTSLLVSISSLGQTVLFEEDFSTGIPETWTLVDEDGLTPAASVAEFTEAWIPYTGTETDTAAASTSFYDPSGQSGDYLITPRVSIGSFTRLIWSARSVDASFPDGYYVMISTTDSLITSFTDTLLTINEEQGIWIDRSIHLDEEGYANQDVFIAFKNKTTDGFILLIDDVQFLGSEFASTPTEITKDFISIYPNPATDFIQINHKEPVSNISIYTATGDLVLQGIESQIDISVFKSGVYTVIIESESGLTTNRFIKQ